MSSLHPTANKSLNWRLDTDCRRSVAPAFAEDGVLLTYGLADPFELYQRAASYVDQILKGASPANLPLQAPTKFAL
jgi:hypothetical protein